MSRDTEQFEQAFAASEELAVRLLSLIRLPLYDESARLRASDLLCSLSIEHWHAARRLLASGLMPSALVVHRAQFEALVRSIWALYGATDDQLDRLNNSELTAETEQAAKNLPQMHDMLECLSKTAPIQAYEALDRFRTNSVKALNSYVHAGIHPLRRHESGYPIPLAISALQNANGLAVLSCMQAVVLSGAQRLQREILDVAAEYPRCMPAPL